MSAGGKPAAFNAVAMCTSSAASPPLLTCTWDMMDSGMKRTATLGEGLASLGGTLVSPSLLQWFQPSVGRRRCPETRHDAAGPPPDINDDAVSE